MKVYNQSSISQLPQAGSVDREVSTAWRPGKFAAQAAGKLKSIFGLRHQLLLPLSNKVVL